MRILHLPDPIGGMPLGLSRGEKRLGLDSSVLATHNSWLNYPCDFCLEWEKKGSFGKLFSALKILSVIRSQYDVFHFNFGRSLISYPSYGVYHWDLPFYTKSSKIIFTYNGCDARQKYKAMELYQTTPCKNPYCYNGACNDGLRDRQRQKSISVVEKYADHIFAVNPDLLNFLPKEKTTFLPYAVAPWYETETKDYKVENKKIRVIHAPTNRAAKGSSYIVDALDSLKKKYELEVLFVENIPNAEAVKIYQTADLVIDQVLGGWYGGFSVEVMKMGCPVAVYIREEDLHYIPEAMARQLKDAVINVNPSNIEDVLSEYFENRHLLKLKSEAGYEYVTKWHDPLYVAGLTKQVYEG